MSLPKHPSFLDTYDALLLDMDGTLIHGTRPIPHAVEAVQEARARGLGISFATNNASRTPDMVVEHLEGMGFEAHPQEVINSPMVALELVKKHAAPGATVLIVGGAGLEHELASAGYRVVREDEPSVEVVVQGFAPDVAWVHLAEAAYAIKRGAAYIATNIDSTLPTEKGFAPGNGSLVKAVSHATGIVPEAAGKPEPAMFTVAAQKLGAKKPLAVGDRLDTDLEAGNRAGIPTLHVLTGVSSWMDAVTAPAVRRPTHIRPDMSYLSGPAVEPVVNGTTSVFGTVTATLEGSTITVSGDAEGWRTPQAVISLVNARFEGEQFDGEVVRADGGELTPLFTQL